MSLSDALGDKLELPGVSSGPINVETEAGRVEVDLVDSDRLGTQIDRLKVSVPSAVPLPQQAENISRRVRHQIGRAHV